MQFACVRVDFCSSNSLLSFRTPVESHELILTQSSTVGFGKAKTVKIHSMKNS